MSARLALVLLVVVLGGFGLYTISQQNSIPAPAISPPQESRNSSLPDLPQSTNSAKNTISSSAKGEIIVETHTNGQEIKSPLTVTGLVYGNNGTLTIKLKQKESGMYVTQDKVVKISGKSANIAFAGAIMFGLPAMPQPGILEVEYKDASGQGLDDKVSIEVNFPSDLGRGE